MRKILSHDIKPEVFLFLFFDCTKKISKSRRETNKQKILVRPNKFCKEEKNNMESNGSSSNFFNLLALKLHSLPV